MGPKVSARAIVTVTLEIDTGSSWGADCSIDQIHRQGAESALGLLDRVIGKEDMRRYAEGAKNPEGGWTAAGYAARLQQLAHEVQRIKVVGRPVVKVLTVEENRG